jgi:uncharacterized membrane protein YciS (DUF1049 family)
MSTGSLILIIISIFGIYFGKNQFLELLINNFVEYSITAMVIGVGFSLPSIVYENDKLSSLNQFLIHMGIGMGIFIVTGIYVGWIPISYGLGTIFLSILIAFAFAILIWASFYLYYQKEAMKMNKQIKKIQSKN